MANTYEYSKIEPHHLKNFYAIGKNKTSLDDSDYNFIVDYRKRLKGVIETIIRAVSMKKPAYKYTGMQDLCKLADDVKEFMRKATTETIMRRVKFLNNLPIEIQAIKDEMINHDGWFFQTDKEIDSVLRTVELFIKTKATEVLIDEDVFADRKKDLTRVIADRMIESLKEKFLLRVDEFDKGVLDLYYLLGASLQKIEETKSQYLKIEQEHCDECKIDDCLISHCKTYLELNEKEAELKTYKTAADLCLSKIFSQSLNQEEIDRTVKSISDDQFKELFNNLINSNVRNVEPRTVVLKGDNSYMVNIVSSELKNEFLSRLGEGYNVDYKNVDHIAITIIDALYDLRWALGDKELKKYSEWKEIYLKYKNDIRYDVCGVLITPKEIFDEYERQEKYNNIKGE